MSKPKNKVLVIFDAHAILHRAYHALPDFSSSKGEPTGALYGLSTMLIKIIQELKPDYVAACFDLPEKTYRHEAYADYKAGRSKAEDDLVAQIIRSRDVFEAFGIPQYEKVGYEADDLIGTIVAKTKNNKDLDVVIASGDMDTLQLVQKNKVQVYTLKKGIKDTILYNEKRVEERYGFSPRLLPDYKGLRGDPSDNIIGIKGIGDKTATDLIKAFGGIDDIYKKLKKNEDVFLKAGIKPRIIELLKNNEEEARFSRMLGEIKCDVEINFELPEKVWPETFDSDNIAKLFRELDFRALSERAKDVFANETAKGAESLFVEEKDESFNDSDFKKASIGLWVINSNISNPSIEDIYAYANTRVLSQALGKIESEIKKSKLEKVYTDIELPLIPILDGMEKHGIKIDTKYLQSLARDFHKKLKVIETNIWNLAGGEFNINSPKQLGEIIFDKLNLTAKHLKKTTGGARSTRESELLKMKDLHPIIAEILSHRELQKLLSTYIDNIPPLVDKECRLHTTFQQNGTTTGRMSSLNPNLQNIPTRSEYGKKIRNAFVAETGYTLASFDYSQIELRVAAILSGDTKLLRIFKNNEDVHTAVASEVFNVSPDKVDKEMRRRAKIINFGILYGMGVTALKDNLGTDRAEAQKFYDDYFKTFSGLSSYLDDVKSSTAKLGYTETLFGRRRYFESIRSPIQYIRASAERMAINAPIQGTSADIIKMAMINIDKYIKKEKLTKSVFPMLQVHDELIFEIENSVIDKVMKPIKEIMDTVLDTKTAKGIPVVVNAYKGPSWGEFDNVD